MPYYLYSSPVYNASIVITYKYEHMFNYQFSQNKYNVIKDLVFIILK